MNFLTKISILNILEFQRACMKVNDFTRKMNLIHKYPRSLSEIYSQYKSKLKCP